MSDKYTNNGQDDLSQVQDMANKGVDTFKQGKNLIDKFRKGKGPAEKGNKLVNGYKKAKSAVKKFSKVGKYLKFLVIPPFPNAVITGIVLLIIIVVVVIVGAFMGSGNSGGQNNAQSQRYIDGLDSDSKDEMKKAKEDAKKDMNEDELSDLEKNVDDFLTEFMDSLYGYDATDSMKDMSSEAGMNIMMSDKYILTAIERLSYAWNFEDPLIYSYEGKLLNKFLLLGFNQFFSDLNSRFKTLMANAGNKSYDAGVYLELDTQIEPVYAVDENLQPTSKVIKSPSLLHNNLRMSIEKSYTESAEGMGKYSDDTYWSDDNILTLDKTEYISQSIQTMESNHKLSAEIIHHESTLFDPGLENRIFDETTRENQDKVIERVKETIVANMPFFQYIKPFNTKKVAGRSWSDNGWQFDWTKDMFLPYELYAPGSFTEQNGYFRFHFDTTRLDEFLDFYRENSINKEVILTNLLKRVPEKKDYEENEERLAEEYVKNFDKVEQYLYFSKPLYEPRNHLIVYAGDKLANYYVIEKGVPYDSWQKTLQITRDSDEEIDWGVEVDPATQAVINQTEKTKKKITPDSVGLKHTNVLIKQYLVTPSLRPLRFSSMTLTTDFLYSKVDEVKAWKVEDEAYEITYSGTLVTADEEGGIGSSTKVTGTKRIRTQTKTRSRYAYVNSTMQEQKFDMESVQLDLNYQEEVWARLLYNLVPYVEIEEEKVAEKNKIMLNVAYVVINKLGGSVVTDFEKKLNQLGYKTTLPDTLNYNLSKQAQNVAKCISALYKIDVVVNDETNFEKVKEPTAKSVTIHTQDDTVSYRFY